MKSQSEIMNLIRKVHMRFAKYFSREFARKRVTPPQYMMLMSLLEEGPQKMNSLAEFLQISTPAVTNLVDKLDKSGYARRVPHPTDRRAHIIELTPLGNKFITRLSEESLELLADTIGILSVADRKVIEKFYQQLYLHLGAALDTRRSR
ncbi:MAG: MarR family transcriptional regulator [Candidatus Aureabacteria bacterium]|nr:MarR family transcriptional regulator [Candidatus Auribacterota bacterium]